MNRTINVMLEFRLAMVCCGSISVSSTLVFASNVIIERNFGASNCAKESQSNRELPRQVKNNSYMTNGKSVNDSYLPLH